MIGGVLVGAVVVGYGLAALATVGLLVPSEWWPGLMVASTAAAALLMGLFFQPGLLLGLAIDAVLLWIVLASLWTPATSSIQ